MRRFLRWRCQDDLVSQAEKLVSVLVYPRDRWGEDYEKRPYFEA